MDVFDRDTIDSWLLHGPALSPTSPFTAMPSPGRSAVAYLAPIVGMLCEPGTPAAAHLFSRTRDLLGDRPYAVALAAAAFGVRGADDGCDADNASAAVAAAVSACAARPGWDAPTLLACASGPAGAGRR